MNDTNGPNGRREDSVPEGGILAALPRTRPQRVSPRRATVPAGASKPAGARTTEKPATKKSAAAEKTPAAKKTATTQKQVGATSKRPVPRVVKPSEQPAPKQGYEPEEEVELGATVHPPSGVELIESVADIVGELAGTGLAAGGRVLKDAFSIFRRP